MSGNKISGERRTAPFTGPNYMVEVRLNDVPIDAYIDTGSVVSLVTENWVKKNLDVEVQPLSKLGDVDDSFTTANGDKLVYRGFIGVDLRVRSISTIYDVILLVVPSVSSEHVLLGTNILALLDPTNTDDVMLLHSMELVRSLASFSAVRCPKRTVIKRNTVNLCMGRLSVKPARFPRTVMMTPTDDAKSLGSLAFADVCYMIPPDVDVVDVPYKVANISDVDVSVNKSLCIYNVSTIDKLVGKEEDPRDATLPDDQFLELFDIDYESYDTEQQKKMRNLLLKYKSLFALNSHQLGCLKGYDYSIELVDNTPVRQRYRPIHPRYYDKLQEQLKIMLSTGVIRECKSPWSSPITIAQKPDGDIRICCDFRVLNTKCKRDAKAIPRIDETLQWLSGNSYFSSTDLLSGYWQIPLDEASQELTAFTAGSEQLYAFQRVPFGHTNSGNHFQRAMEDVLRGLIYKHCIVYLDDICIISKDFDGHCKSVELVFDRLLSSGLKLKPRKCCLFRRQLRFLGHLVSGAGVRCDPDKTRVIEEWEEPKSTKDCRRFLGVVGFYRKFISNFSKRASPITDLLKGSTIKRSNGRKKFVPVPFEWGDEQKKSFLDLRRALLDDVVLKYPDYERPFILEIDASRAGYGAVLSQMHEGRRLPVAFGSRKTSKAESMYPAHKLEFAALRWSVCQKFRDYLHHSFVDVYTDSNPVVYILQKLEIDAVSQRWCAELAKYDFKIHYRSGKTNTVADSLSRLTEADGADPVALKKWCEEILSDGLDQTDGNQVVPNLVVKAVFSSCSSTLPMSEQCIVSAIQNRIDGTEEDDVLDKVEMLVEKNPLVDFRALQENDDDIQFVIKNIVGKSELSYRMVKEKSHFVKNLFKKRSQLVIENGMLYKMRMKYGICSKQLVVNESCLDILIQMYHEQQAHLGQDRTVSIISDRFYWPRMSIDVMRALKGCKTCLARKTLPSLNKEEMYHRPLPRYPMDVIAMDHLTIDSRDGQMKILTIVDEYSKFMWVVPVRRENAAMTADAVMNCVFLRYGIPNVIHSDQGKAFNNKLLDKLVRVCGINKTMSTPGWSQGNPVAERVNSVILNMMGTLKPSEKVRWHRHCDYICYAYNTSIHVSTGMSPYFLMFGRHPRLIGDTLLNITLEQPSHDNVDRFVANLKKAYAVCTRKLDEKRIKYKKFYDSKISRDIQSLKVGDIVLVKNERPYNKIDNRWKPEPYIVISQPNTDIPVFEVKDMDTDVMRVKHRNQLLPMYRAEVLVPPKEKKKKKQPQPIVETHISSSEYETGSEYSPVVQLEVRSLSERSEQLSLYDGLSSSNSPVSSDTEVEDGLVRTKSGRAVRPRNVYSPSNYSIMVTRL